MAVRLQSYWKVPTSLNDHSDGYACRIFARHVRPVPARTVGRLDSPTGNHSQPNRSMGRAPADGGRGSLGVAGPPPAAPFVRSSEGRHLLASAVLPCAVVTAPAAKEHRSLKPEVVGSSPTGRSPRATPAQRIHSACPRCRDREVRTKWSDSPESTGTFRSRRS